jgi:membrane-bound lytic murein transglycosylase A
MRSRIPGVLFLFILVFVGIAAWFILPRAERPRGPLKLTRVAYADLPGWTHNDASAALAAFRRSCAVILRSPPGTELGSYAKRAVDWQPVCRAALASTSNAAGRFFESNFAVFEIQGAPLFTGYYEPLLHGSRTRHGVYRTPVYGRPHDLISVDLGAFRPEWKGERLAGRVSDDHLAPYATRAEIDQFPPAAPALFYCDDPVAVFFLHIQGSGRVALDDGAIVRVAYAAQNGRPYTAIGRTLVRSGRLAREDLSMQAIRAWLKSNPSAARQVMETDQSYVFFKEAPVGDASLGSAGAQGVALTPLASIAIDQRYHALGAPFFIAATTPDGAPLQKLFIAQDTGGAIRGAARADIFFGFGPRAERLAGGMKSAGRFFVLLPNALAAKVAR